jgi:tetrahydromethanopterin S-methyltransferase subunit G
MNLGKYLLNVVVVFIAFGVLYGGSMALMADTFSAAKALMRPDEEIMMSTMAYHLAQTLAIVWLFNKAVGSGDLKAGAMFGAVVGFYLMATNATWFIALQDFPQDSRLVLSIMNIVYGALVGMLLAFMQRKGWGSGGEGNTSE